MSWYVGQKVVCVDAKRHETWEYNPLRNRATYHVVGVFNCKCGRVLLDVGINSYTGGTRCRCNIVVKTGAWWFNCTRFRPLDALTEQVERIEKEGAPVEPELIEA